MRVMTRRSALQALPVALASAPLVQGAPAGAARLKQSVARWCYASTPLEELCRQAAEMGLRGIDLVEAADWPTVRKYGLVPTITQGQARIPDGWNRKENHDRLEAEIRARLTAAAEAQIPNAITFSGNRRGISDAEGMENCVIGLKRIAKFAEDKGVTVCMELLNSKVNHKDYQCDHTAWGVAVIEGVGSPRVKLLYDIYHMQIMEGDIIRTIRENIQHIAHFHTGGVPGRHELDGTQELEWRAIATAIADLGFEGYVAHEFQPVRDPMTSLREAVELCRV